MNKPIYFKVYQEKEEDALKVDKINQILTCSCYFSCTMRLPCEHILACLIQSTDTETHKMYLQNILKLYDERWHESEGFNVGLEDKLSSFIKQYKFKSESKSELEDNIKVELGQKFHFEKDDQEEAKISNEEENQDRGTQEEILQEKKQNVLNPSEVKTCGRPAEIKRISSYYEKKKDSLKRKAINEMKNPNELKKEKNMNYYFSQ